MIVTFSVVVYKETIEDLTKVVKSLLLYTFEKVIYVVDNSPTNEASVLCSLDDCIVYQHFPQNIGFGKAHNWAIAQAMKTGSVYHFVVNPDVYYETDVAAPMIAYFESHPEIGEMMPKILYPNGRHQYLPKLMPNLLMLAQRRTSKLLPVLRKKWMKKFEMRDMRDDAVYEIGHVTGSFSAFRMKALEVCGTYDERFFMYFEDTDISRRIHQKFKTIYFPMVSIVHNYRNGATKSPKLFLIFICSLIKFFNKWGWFFDEERKRCNRMFLSQLEKNENK